jgi:hypothetical protein
MSNILNNNKFVFFDFSKNTTNVIEEKDEGKTLSIDLERATDREKELVKHEIIDPLIQEQDQTFFLQESTEKTTLIKKNLPDKEDKELLDFYKDKLKYDWVRALEVSLIVKKAFETGEEIRDMKTDLRRKYPDFGNNLCKLVSSGYFHGHFKELYSSMRQDEDFEITLYQSKVEKIVKSLPYIVFIDKYRSYNEMSGEVHFKIGKLRKYGAGKLILHALSKENVMNALLIIDDFKNDGPLEVRIDINKQKTVLTAVFSF